ncbi:hypothetical protein N7537_001760 [Penicillium hordei]|uniref:Uncharacterized protein n=1 Tax=Penicillium hordei TaxID=40994 RepID=A0AAD6EG33_9EURO|nr:uncharacterized protein N7537_001760 [Penicillium hordei]KAJ5616646.1 hypothetical protein N7537_001760 [Penicillium hordei]
MAPLEAQRLAAVPIPDGITARAGTHHGDPSRAMSRPMKRNVNTANGSASSEPNLGLGLEGAESDLHWEAATDAIRSNIFATLAWDLQHGRRERGQSHRVLRDGYCSLVFDDETGFDGATTAQARENSKAFVKMRSGLVFIGIIVYVIIYNSYVFYYGYY